jgi:hypothetical protein
VGETDDAVGHAAIAAVPAVGPLTDVRVTVEHHVDDEERFAALATVRGQADGLRAGQGTSE